MTTTDEVAKIVSETPERASKEASCQLRQLDQIEATLQQIGVPLKERYEVPLSSRLDRKVRP